MEVTLVNRPDYWGYKRVKEVDMPDWLGCKRAMLVNTRFVGVWVENHPCKIDDSLTMLAGGDRDYQRKDNN